MDTSHIAETTVSEGLQLMIVDAYFDAGMSSLHPICIYQLEQLPLFLSHPCSKQAAFMHRSHRAPAKVQTATIEITIKPKGRYERSLPALYGMRMSG